MRWFERPGYSAFVGTGSSLALAAYCYFIWTVVALPSSHTKLNGKSGPSAYLIGDIAAMILIWAVLALLEVDVFHRIGARSPRTSRIPWMIGLLFTPVAFLVYWATCIRKGSEREGA